jgi:hypothetical protein
MSSLVRALTVQRLLQEDTTLRMLRMDTLPLLAGVLAEHLGAPHATVPTQELHESLDAELDSLRTHLDLSDRTAKAYCDDWRQAGLLVRRSASDARGETYELTPQARQGLRFLEQLVAPRATVTESRLVSLTAALHQLAIDTDPDVQSRLEALHVEREALDERIRRVRAGESDVLAPRQALERVADVLAQAEDLPTDFARVRSRFEELNHELRVIILSGDELPGGVLDEVFRGVDLIESSEEGQTFAAFSRMVRDPETSESFEADLRAVLDRQFARSLPPASRAALRSLVRTLKEGSRTVQDTLAEFARGLRRYVLSLEYQRDRQLRLTLQEALAAAVPAATTTRPYQQSGLDLEMTGMQLASIGEVGLYDPSDYDVGPVLVDAPVAVVDVETLRAIARQTEIDFAELEDNVHRVLEEISPASVAAVLDRFPASQGVASVVGLLSLAARHGAVDSERTELVSWASEDGDHRQALVLHHSFTGRIRP